MKGFQAGDTGPLDCYYYRTKNGVEVDLVLEGHFGVLPVEIKLEINITGKNVSSIQKFVSDNNLPLGLVISNNEEVYTISRGIVNIPAGLI